MSGCRTTSPAAAATTVSTISSAVAERGSTAYPSAVPQSSITLQVVSWDDDGERVEKRRVRAVSRFVIMPPQLH